MSTPAQAFIAQVEALMTKTVGQIVGRSLVSNQLKKLQKDAGSLTAADCNAVSQNIVTALALFAGAREVELAKVQLSQLVKAHFC